ncbi:MAG: RNA methyltransferase [Clostridia bacterium]|nr:RNA methyltransferase [Clostridia bacterium]
MIITSKNNPLIKETVSLKDKKGRKQLGAFLVEGKKMAEECLKSALSIERVFIAQSYCGELPFEESLGVQVSDDVFRYLSDEKTPQGVLCRVKIPCYPVCPPHGKCLFLDGVADPGNLGTIIRTANAAGYREIYLTRDCTDAYSPKCVRASMSGIFFTKLYEGEREEILSALSATPIVVADMGGKNLFSYASPKKFALVIGNEANGVSEIVRAAASDTVRIPMQSTQESLNAAVAAGIAMYQLAKNEFTEN